MQALSKSHIQSPPNVQGFASHALLSGLTPHLKEHVGANVQGDLELAMAMAQRLEVYHGGDGANTGGEKKGTGGKFKKQNKRGLSQRCRAMRRRKLSG